MTTMIAWGLFAFLLSFLATVFVKRLAISIKLVDKPEKPRKVHKRPTAQLGGLAIFFAFAATVIGVLASSPNLVSGQITTQHYIGVLLAGLILIIGGIIDDRYDLPAHSSIIAPIVASLVTILFGIEVEKLTNPFGGVVYLTAIQSNILVFVWLMVVMYTTKFLDGLDGLATSISSVGALMVFLLSMTVAYYQPDVALLSAIVIGSYLGFLFWNIHPASIFLGEGGSTLVGFLIGVLAVISGGKLATALLVLGIPLLDVVWVVLRRFKQGGLRRIVHGDKKHLHHRLFSLGWGQNRVILLYIIIATIFGVSTLFLQSREKLVALIILCLLMFLGATFLVQKEKQNKV